MEYNFRKLKRNVRKGGWKTKPYQVTEDETKKILCTEHVPYPPVRDCM